MVVQWQGAEMDAKSAGNGLKILPGPTKVAEGWRITWNSVAGAQYKLQRLDGDAIGSGNLKWIEVQSVTASADTATGVDLSPAARQRFYRVVLEASDDISPTIGILRADPVTAKSEGIVVLSVEAQDNLGVAGVSFFDGNNLLGSGTRVEGNEWDFLWPLEFSQNGIHSLTARAADSAGNVATSPVLSFTAAITNHQAKQIVGQVPINADKISSTGTVSTPSGNIRIGNATLGSGSVLTMDSANNKITGNGTVLLPGTGQVYSGAFSVDAASGWLTPVLSGQTAHLHANAVTLPPIQLSSGVTVQPINLTVNVLNSALAGSGTVLLKVSDEGTETVQFEGAFQFNYQQFALTLDGKCTYSKVEASGHVVLDVSDKTFQVDSATLNFSGSAGSIFKLTEGRFGLEFTTPTQPKFSIEGKISLPLPANINVVVKGSMDLQGALALNGSGSGSLAGFSFDPLEATLTRSSATGVVNLSFHGSVHHAVGTLSIGGKVDSSGAVSELSSGVEDVNLGSGVRLLVENGQPVLKYLEDIAGIRRFAVAGGFRVPGADSVVTSVHVEGTLEVEGTFPNVRVHSFSASSAVDLNLTLPGSIVAKKAHVSLGYGNSQFAARLGGEISLGDSARIPFDAGLILNENDPQDIQIDVGVSPSNLALGPAFLLSSNVRLEARTLLANRTASGKITVQGAAGVFKKGVLPANPSLADFLISVTGVTAVFSFQQENFSAAFTSGTLNLPSSFSTRVCAGVGGGPAVSISPTTPLSLTYNAGTRATALGGAFDFRNLGFEVPNSGGVMLELCTARLTLTGQDHSISNISGRILIPSANGDFQITDGSINATGQFGLTTSGRFTLDQTQVTYQALRVTYDGVSLAFSGTGRAAFPNGTNVDVSVQYAGNQFHFIATQNRLDFGDGVVLVPVEPAAQNPMVRLDKVGNNYSGEIKGRLVLPNSQFVEMAGGFNNNSITLDSTARVHLGNGVWLTPIQDEPVLKLQADVQGNLSFSLAGLFQLPGKDGGTEQIVVSGNLVLADGPIVSSFTASSSTPNLTLSIDPNLVLRQAGASLDYSADGFHAQIHGAMDLANTTTVNVAAALILNPANQDDVQIDAALGVQNLNVLDQAYFFSTALGLQMQTQTENRPGFTRLRVQGKAGLFPLVEPIAANPQDSDFHLLVRNAIAVLDVTSGGFVGTLNSGTLALPSIFTAGLCPGGAGGPSVSVTSANPLILIYVEQPESLTFTGAINFQNLGLGVPGLPNLAAEFCTAKLVFTGAQLPYITNINGHVTIPFPEGQTTAVDIRNGAWEIDGYPTGTISLGNDVTIYDKNDLRVRLLSAQSAACPRGSSLTVVRPAAGQGPKFIIDGGIEASLPLSMLTDVQGDHAKGSVCGTVTVVPPDSVNFQVTDFTFGGTFHFGGLDGVTIENASLTLRGLDNLLNSNSTQPFGIDITGDLSTADNVRFSLRRSSFTFQRLADGSFRPLRLGGSGQLGLPQGLTIDASLDLDIPAQTLVFNSSASNLQLRLTDDLVLFDAGFGFTVDASHESGELRASGSAGLFAKTTPLPTTVRRQDFYLIVDQLQTALALKPGEVDLRLENGTLRLPEIFTAGLCENGTATGGASLDLNLQHPIVISFLENGGNNQPAITFSGEIQFQNLGFRVPDFPELSAELCSAKLVFSSSDVPYFTEVSGTVTVPLPPDRITRIDVVNAAWKLNGFPHGTIVLPQDVKVFDQGGFTFTVLGGKSCGETLPPTSLVINEAQIVNGTVQLPKLEFHGGIELKVAKSTLENDTTEAPSANNPDPEQVHGSACGSLILEPETFPRLSLESFGIGGNFKIGSGIKIKDASLHVEGIEHVFDQSDAHPLLVTLGGKIDVDHGPAFGIQNARFVFFDNSRLPRFEPGKFIYQQDDWDLPNKLPIVVREAALEFVDGSRSNLEELFQPSNVKVGLSATIAIPTAADPYFSGTINDMQVSFSDNGEPHISIDGFAVTLDPGIKIPPIDEIGGSIYISGLNDAARDPTSLFFTGRVAGSYQGYKLKFLLAFNMLGPIGMCVDVNAGSVGIPLGQTGFLISGASGGFSFINSNADPCNFSSYIDPDGKPVSNPLQGGPPFPIQAMSWAQLKDYAQRFAEGELRPSAMVHAANQTGEIVLMSAGEDNNVIPCPGDCPPATVNLFCQPHPDSERFPHRIITKFTSIDEGTLNSTFGITEERIQDLLNASTDIATTIAHTIRLKLDETTPDPDALLGSENAARIRALQVRTFDTIETAFQEALAATLGNDQVASSLYGKIRDIVYAGLPCADVTFKVSGTLTHLSVSSFLSVTGEGALSTTGTAGVSGKVNLLGVPVGIGKVFVAATDAKGLPNPSVCGDVNVAIGPLELGYLKGSLECEECVSGVLQIFADLVVKLSRPVIQEIVTRVKPGMVLPSNQQELAAFLNNNLAAVEKLAFMAELFAEPPDKLPVDLDQVILTARDAVGLILERINPELLMCGQVKPKIFGIPMGGEWVGASYRLNKHGRDALVRISPSAIISYFISDSLLPPVDTATLGYSEVFPDFGKTIMAALTGKLSSPEAAAEFAKDQFASMLENSTYTAGYEFSPMGFKLARAQGRVINPDLTSHPLIRQPAWVHPETRGLGLLSREQLLQAALRANVLGNSLWKGNTGDLPTIFPENSPERALYQSQNLSLTHDYFPHGGFVGAGYLDVPKAFYEAVPPEFYKMIDPNNQLLQRLQSALTYVNGYVLQQSEAGVLNFYVPAPNPPAFERDGHTLSPIELLDSIMHQDVQSIKSTPLYPSGEFFFQGELHGKLLGVDLADAHMVAVPGGANEDAYFRVEAALAQNGWVKQFVDQASLLFEIRQRPSNYVAAIFQEFVPQLQDLINQSTLDQAAAQTLLAKIDQKLQNGMPKVVCEAVLDNIHIPPELQDYLKIDGTATGKLFAYSPRYQPGAAGTGAVADAKRNGGFAIQANLRIGDIVSIPNAELSVILQNSGPPLLSGNFTLASLNAPGFTLSGVNLAFKSAPDLGAPFFNAQGTMTEIQIDPLLTIAPLSGKSTLSGGFRIERTAAGAAKVLQLSPAQIKAAFIDPTKTLYIDGGAADADFILSTDPNRNWSARVRTTEAFSYKKNGTELFRYKDTSVQGTISGKGTASASIHVTIDPAIDFTILPGNPTFERTFRFSGANTELVLNSDGTFLIKGAVDRDLDLSNWGDLKVSIKAGTEITLTQDEFSFALNGNAAGPFGAEGSEGALKLNLSSLPQIGVNVSGTVAFDPLHIPATDPIFELLPLDGTAPKLTAAIANNIISLSGAKLRVNGVLANEVVLPALTLAANGQFSQNVSADLQFTFPGKQSTLAASQAGFTLKYAAGLLSITDIVASVTLPVYGHQVSVTGYIDSDGSAKIAGTDSSQLTLATPVFHPPVAFMKSNATMKFERSASPLTFVSFTLEGEVEGGLLSQFSFAVSPRATIGFNTDGPTGISGQLQASAWNFGAGTRFQLTGKDGTGSFNIGLGSSNLSYSGESGLWVKRTVLSKLTFMGNINPGFPFIQPDGKFSFPLNNANLTLNNFSLGGNFALTESGLASVSGRINVPFFNVPSFVSGSIPMQLTSPISLNGPVADLTFGKYRFKPAGGISFDGAGITLVNPSFGVDGLFSFNFAQPFTIDSLGQFASTISATSLNLPFPNTTGFSITAPQVTLGRTADAMTASLAGKYQIPGFASILSLAGDINSDAAYSLVSVPIELPLGRFTLKPTGITLDPAGMHLLTPTFSATGFMQGLLNLNDLTLPPAGTFNQTVNLSNFTVPSPFAGGDYSFSGVQFTVEKSASSMVIKNFTGALNVANLFSLPMPLLGTVGPTGGFTFFGTLPSLPIGKFNFSSNIGPIPTTITDTAGLYLANLQFGAENIINSPIQLSALTILGNGNFQQSFNAPSLTFDGYSFGNAALTVKRTGGITSLDVAGAIHTPASGPSLSFNGTIASDGTIDLANSLSSGGFNNFPVSGSSTLIAGPSRYRANVLHDTPFAYWRLGDNYDVVGKEGYLVRDEKGSHPGIVSSTVKYGGLGAISGDADSSFALSAPQFISVSKSADFNTPGPLTLEAWIKVTSFTSAYEAIITKGDSGWRLQRNGTANTIGFDTDGLNPPYLSGSTSVADKKWHHVVAVYDGTAKCIYIDGKLDASANVTGAINSNDYEVRIGENAQATSRYFEGNLDEVAFYKRALSADDVARHYVTAHGNSLFSDLRVQLGQMANLNLRGYIASSGAMNLSGRASSSLSLAGFNTDNLDATFSRPDGNSASFTISASTTLNLGNVLSATPSFNGSITFSGIMTVDAYNQDVQVLGYSMPDVHLYINDLISNTGASLRFSDGYFKGLRYPYLANLPFAGSISKGGTLSCTANHTVSFGGFAGASTAFNFSNSGLFADTTPSFNVPGVSGSLKFGGYIASNGSYDLRCKTGNLAFGNYSLELTDNDLKLGSGGIRPTGSGPFLVRLPGGASVSVSDLSITSSGLQSLSGSSPIDSGWKGFGKDGNIHPRYRTKGSVGLGVDNNSIKVSMSASFAAWFAPGFDPSDDDFDSIANGLGNYKGAATFKGSGSGSLNSDGDYSVDIGFDFNGHQIFPFDF
jgi:hypothetical protein